MENNDWFHSYRVELVLETDESIDCLKDLKWWEDLTHTDENPYFLVTKVVKVKRR